VPREPVLPVLPARVRARGPLYRAGSAQRCFGTSTAAVSTLAFPDPSDAV
jgi:hypothetical protein